MVLIAMVCDQNIPTGLQWKRVREEYELSSCFDKEFFYWQQISEFCILVLRERGNISGDGLFKYLLHPFVM